MCTLCNRRQFLGATAWEARPWPQAHCLLKPLPQPPKIVPSPPATTGKVPIAVIVAGKAPDRSWSLSEAEVSALTRRLSEVERKLGNVEFVVGVASNAAETSELLEHAGPDAPVLAISADIFGLAQGVMPTVFKEARPVAVFHLPVIGSHDWCLVKPWREEGQRITSTTPPTPATWSRRLARCA